MASRVIGAIAAIALSLTAVGPVQASFEKPGLKCEIRPAGDRERTVAVTREAYAQMFKVGDALATAIADQFPGQFKDVKAMPATDSIACPHRQAVPTASPES